MSRVKGSSNPFGRSQPAAPRFDWRETKPPGSARGDGAGDDAEAAEVLKRAQSLPALLLATEEYVVLAGARSSSPGRLEVDACAHVARPCAAWASWRSAAAVFWSPNFAAPRLTALSRASLRAG